LLIGWFVFVFGFTPLYWISTYFAWNACNGEPGFPGRGCEVYRWGEAHDDGLATPLVVLYGVPIALVAIAFFRRARHPAVLRTAALLALAWLAFSIVVATNS
jgi:hypothetical protein